MEWEEFLEWRAFTFIASNKGFSVTEFNSAVAVTLSLTISYLSFSTISSNDLNSPISSESGKEILSVGYC